MKRILSLMAVCLLLFAAGCSANGDEVAELREQIAVLEYRVEQLEEQLANGADAYDESTEEEHVPAAEDSVPVDSEQDPRGMFSSIEQVRGYFDERFPELMMSAHLMNNEVDYCWVRSGWEIYQTPATDPVGRTCIVHATTYLLQDDMDIATVIAFRSQNGEGEPMLSINCIKTDKGYTFVDPVLGMQGDEGSRFEALLPEKETASIEEYVQIVLGDSYLAGCIDNIYLIRDAGEIRFMERPDGYAELISEGEHIYHRDSALTNEEYAAHIKPENIGSYQLSNELGGVTITAQEAYALVDAAPEEAQKKIQTAADVLMYMLAAQTADCGGCFCEQSGGYTWHYNLTAKEVMEQKKANCGACANLVNYLLADDYDEVGIIQHAYYPDNGGGHVYNYILYEGSYYIVDLSWYIFANYDPAQDFPVMRLATLEAYGEKVHELYGGVSMVIALTSPGQHLPNIFGEEFGDVHYYVPEGAEYILLYEAADGYRIGEMPLDKNFHDWTKYW